MVLIFLYCLSVIFFFIKIEPFTIAGVFLSICYLPGLSIFFIGNKEKINFEDLFLAFPCSLGISGLLTLGLLFIGINVNYVPNIIHIIMGVIVLIFVITNRKKTYPVLALEKKEIIFCLFALLMTLIFSIPFFIGPDRGPIAAHAFHHSSFVSQILHGIFPPENPGLGGTKIGYYWGFHAFIAALTSHTGFQQLQIVFMLNAIALFMIFCIAYSFSKYFGLPEKFCYIMPLAVIGLMRSDAGLYVIYKLFSGKLISLNTLTSQQMMLPSDLLDRWLIGITWYDPRLLYLNKFYNISAMPVTISICLSYFLILLILLKVKLTDNTIYLVMFAIIIIACILNYPPLAIVPLLYTPIWACVIFLSTKGSHRDKVKETLTILLPYITGVLIVLPYILFIMASRDISSSGQGSVLSLAFNNQSVKNLVVFLLPFPVIIYGAWIVFKRFHFSKEGLFLFSATALCFGLSVLTKWPFDNSYKFNYILIIFCALFFMFAISRLLSLLSKRSVIRFITAIPILYLLLTPFIVEAAYIISCLSMDRYLTFADGHIIYAQDKQKNEAYSWIRENTPSNSLIMFSYIKTTYPCCGTNRNYEVAALSERTQYVIKDTDYTISNPEYARRVEFREKLFTTPEDPSVIKFFSELNRPVYLLVESNLEEDIFVVEERFKHFPENPGRPFVLKFQNGRQWVYFIDVRK
jgi:hypothetical protein